MTTKPTVGRQVHYYCKRIPNVPQGQEGYGLNGQGYGPYPATILQTIPGGAYVNLRVLGWGQSWDEGSVAEKGSEHASDDRYWEWPPRD